ncbi:hypothetical protein TRIUR3_07571 [Triticum urartu]|uniref:Uncharacterized protein n=2 Tax=Triticum urartu TaxID=4572 RepID=M7ZZD2_TRIUA|nr:hypothetical protein TRIUR3_07571 [Triticum urartu]
MASTPVRRSNKTCWDSYIEVILMAARASRTENQDAIDTAIVGMLADPKEARAGIQEVHFLPFNPTDKRTALTYIDADGKMHRVSKGAPEQILHLAHNTSEIERMVLLASSLLGFRYHHDYIKGKDRVKPSPLPDSWKLAEIFTTGVILGGCSYLAIMTVIFFWAAYKTNFFPILFHVEIKASRRQLRTISKSLRLRFTSKSAPSAKLSSLSPDQRHRVGLYNIITYLPLDIIKFLIRYTLSGKAWDLVIDQRIAFTRKKDFGKEERELKWAHALRTLHMHGLQPPDAKMFSEKGGYNELIESHG